MANGQVQLHGLQYEYGIANDGGTLYIDDGVAGRDGSQLLPGVQEMVFTNGVGLFDPTGTAENVARLYGAALNRAPDLGGLEAWTNMVDAGQISLAGVANSMATSPEFLDTYGSLTDGQFVQLLYDAVLGRDGNANEVQTWLNVIGTGSSRGEITASFAESPEGRATTLNYAGDENDAEAYRLYQAAFNHAPDSVGQAYWSTALANGTTPAQVAQNFVGSAEFQQTYGSLSPNDFISTLYDNALGRDADDAGLQFWTGQMAKGMTQGQVLASFADSVENRVNTSGATHDAWVYIQS